MCEHPIIILSQYALQYNCMCEVVFNGEVLDCSNIFKSDEIKAFLHNYNRLTFDIIYQYVYTSHISYSGNSYPLFCALPCSRCSLCRLDYKQEIENRAIIEAAHSGTVVFYTLTYTDKNLPQNGLNASHLSQAFKRFRTYINRYLPFDAEFTQIYAGEYGTDPLHGMRPHYHGIMFFKCKLSTKELSQLRDLFNPSISQLSEYLNTLNSSQKSYFLELLNKKDITVSKFYQEHNELTTFWPFGILYDFKIAQNLIASTRYVTKYITKSHIVAQEFAINKEKSEAHWNPFFVQLPKRIGLGCKYLDYYKKSILNSTDGKISIYPLFDSKKRIYKIKIPNLFIKKLFPTVGQLCKNCVFNAHVVNSLLSSVESLKYTSDIPYFKNLNPIELQELNITFAPHRYLTKFSLKRKQKLKLDTLTTYILGIYHNNDYQIQDY